MLSCSVSWSCLACVIFVIMTVGISGVKNYFLFLQFLAYYNLKLGRDFTSKSATEDQILIRIV